MTNRKPIPLRLPDGIDRQRFLREYWQHKPLLMRQALPLTAFALHGDEIAGLACDDDIESRLIIERGDTPWQVQHGPFDAARFARLPSTHWTLLVQDVDKFVPDVARLIDAFDFLPAWRIDDIMVSYAVDQGGVGPHSDAYDVFLMQAAGRRRWRLSYCDYGDDDLIPGLEQRVLAHFASDQEWLLEAGDVLYLPPGVAHWGTADGECVTYSLGFRAPSRRELAADWFQHLVSLADETRIVDPDDLDPANSAQLTDSVVACARALLDDLPGGESDTFARWFGCHMTEPKPQFQLLPAATRWSLDDLTRYIADGGGLVRHPAARIAWARSGGEHVTLYYQGEYRELPARLAPLARRLAETREFGSADLASLVAGDAAGGSLLVAMFNDGIFERAHPD